MAASPRPHRLGNTVKRVSYFSGGVWLARPTLAAPVWTVTVRSTHPRYSDFHSVPSARSRLGGSAGVSFLPVGLATLSLTPNTARHTHSSSHIVNSSLPTFHCPVHRYFHALTVRAAVASHTTPLSLHTLSANCDLSIRAQDGSV